MLAANPIFNVFPSHRDLRIANELSLAPGQFILLPIGDRERLRDGNNAVPQFLNEL